MEHKPIAHGEIVIADASKFTPSQFLEHFFGPYEPKRQETYQRCINVILSGGSLYGWPPMMVEHCRELIAEGHGVKTLGEKRSQVWR